MEITITDSFRDVSGEPYAMKKFRLTVSDEDLGEIERTFDFGTKCFFMQYEALKQVALFKAASGKITEDELYVELKRLRSTIVGKRVLSALANVK